jgi:hypothetical protein
MCAFGFGLGPKDAEGAFTRVFIVATTTSTSPIPDTLIFSRPLLLPIRSEVLRAQAEEAAFSGNILTLVLISFLEAAIFSSFRALSRSLSNLCNSLTSESTLARASIFLITTVSDTAIESHFENYLSPQLRFPTPNQKRQSFSSYTSQAY